MQVRHVMDTDPPIIAAERSLRETIKLMIAKEVDYAIVVDSEGNPGGIITESDILHAVYQADPPPEEIRVVAVAHAPEFTVEPSLSLRKAVRELVGKDQNTAPVMDGLELVGMISLEMILDHPSITIQEMGLDEQSEEWEGS